MMPNLAQSPDASSRVLSQPIDHRPPSKFRIHSETDQLDSRAHRYLETIKTNTRGVKRAPLLRHQHHLHLRFLKCSVVPYPPHPQIFQITIDLCNDLGTSSLWINLIPKRHVISIPKWSGIMQPIAHLADVKVPQEWRPLRTLRHTTVDLSE